jgi:uncharacterized protein (UPF0276 family)
MSTFGLGFRPKYYHRVVSAETAVDFYEIISENFMGVGGRPARFLAQLRERYPIVMHGVGLGVAGVAPLRDDYVTALRQLVDHVNPRYVSDHLCWTTHAHRNSHDLLPVKLTEETLALVAGRLAELQDRLGRRFYIENPSAYVAFAENDMDEATFLAELVRQSGCGLLLDVNNVFVNAANLGYDAVAYLRTLPREAVGYFHLAGHTVRPEVRIDTHDMPVCPEVWTLYRLAAHRFPAAPTLLERDDNYPPFEELEAELAKARQLREEALDAALEELEARVAGEFPTPVSQPLRSSAERWERTTSTMYELVAQTDNVTEGDERVALFDRERPVPALRGINVYNDAYFFRLRDCIRDGLSVLELVVGESRFARMLSRYLAACPPSHYDVKWAGAKLPTWLREVEAPWSETWSNAALADLAALELCRSDLYDAADGAEPAPVSALASVPAEAWEGLTVAFRPCVRVVATAHDVWEAWSEGDAGRMPGAPPPAQACEYLVYRWNEDVYHERMEAGEARLFEALARGETFGAACRAFTDGAEVDAAAAEAVVAHLVHWFGKGLVERIKAG